MIKIFVFLLLATTCCGIIPSLCIAGDEFLDEVSEVTNPDAAAPSIESTDVGYDLHRDIFYYRDKSVEDAFKRSMYADTKVTLAGQRPDMTGRRAPKAVNPFAVAQKSVGVSGSSADRWDVKQDANGNQYLALFHGYKSHHVVNKLRAHLLTSLANHVKDYLPVLDQTYKHIENGERDEYTSTVREDIIRWIKFSFDINDGAIKERLKPSDESSASATVAIVTKYFVIVASAGDGRVLAYDGNSVTRDLTPKHISNVGNVFGMGYGKKAKNCVPYVEVYQRFMKDDEDFDYETQFLVLETPVVANLIADNEVINTVISSVKQHKSNVEAEQDIYTDSVNHIMQTAAKKGGILHKLGNTDYSVLLVGLQTNYKLIF